MAQYHLKRLKELHSYIKGIPKSNLVIESWMRHELSKNCGTAGCFGGHAVLNKKFRRAGLKYAKDVGIELPPLTVPYEPYYQGELAYAALRKFFNLSYDESYHLFHPAHYSPIDRADLKDIFLTRLGLIIEEREKEL